MAKIRLDIDFPIINGTPITFKAPCPCSDVEGLAVYYPKALGSEDILCKVFTFKDAHRNDLTNLGDLFVQDAYVKVILDVSNSVAYIQNADTNAYLEGKFAECLAETGVEPGTYGGYVSSSGYYNIPNVTVDEYGRVTKVSNSVLNEASIFSRDTLGLVSYNMLTNIGCTSGLMYWLSKDSVLSVNTSTLSSVKLDTVNYSDSTGKLVGVQVARILDVQVYVYTSESSTVRQWVSVPYKTYCNTDSMSGSLYTSLYIEPPEEYYDYSTGKYLDGTPITESSGYPEYTACFLYRVLYEQDPTKVSTAM